MQRLDFVRILGIRTFCIELLLVSQLGLVGFHLQGVLFVRQLHGFIRCRVHRLREALRLPTLIGSHCFLSEAWFHDIVLDDRPERLRLRRLSTSFAFKIVHFRLSSILWRVDDLYFFTREIRIIFGIVRHLRKCGLLLAVDEELLRHHRTLVFESRILLSRSFLLVSVKERAVDVILRRRGLVFGVLILLSSLTRFSSICLHEGVFLALPKNAGPFGVDVELRRVDLVVLMEYGQVSRIDAE